MMRSYFVGNTVRLTVNFLTATDQVFDPTTVTFEVLRPGPQHLTPAPVKAAAGVYYVDVVVDTPGAWKYRASSLNPASANEGVFEVKESPFA